MPLGVEVTTRTAPAARGESTQTDTLFLAGEWTAGSTTPVLCKSIADVEASFTTRSANADLWDYLDVYFREGGRRAYVVKYTAGDLENALGLFEQGFGPGQVVAPSTCASPDPSFGLLLDHAAEFNRFALLDGEIGDDAAALADKADLIPAENTEYGALFGPSVIVPAPAGVVGGSERTVHASAVIAGLIARADALGNPNRAAAGRDFPLQYGIGFDPPISDNDRSDLLDVGVNTFATKYGVLMNYGFQTKVAQDDSTPFWQANAVRARMALVAAAREAGEAYMFKNIDGKGRLARALQSDLDAVCLNLYNADGLFGETPADAFSTEVGASVNTVDNVAQGVLSAVVEARFSLHAKRVLIELVSVPVTGVVTSA
ncbi:hypothetical protein UFOVP1313_10 [uncultured Caudovirales phage]|uniref:Uncharacterized protein n=1 Tax=uncultured Caudovirales phage TaxID=2100421 RepID=A0A6J5RUV9_9CAUD|nr:hypothetical protein UFOVP1313_10 [uncultured Caudovirales phage]